MRVTANRGTIINSYAGAAAPACVFDEGGVILGGASGPAAGFYSTIVTAYRDWETDRKSTRLNSSHSAKSRMPSSA